MAAKDNHQAIETMTNETGCSKDSNDFEAGIKQGFAALMPTIRASNSLPKGQQWDLFCTSPLFKPIMDSLGNRALELMSLILQRQGMYRDIRKRDLEEKYELIVEANDKILERVGIYLDVLSGIRHNPSGSVADIAVSQFPSASGSWNRDIGKSAAWREVKLTKTAEIPVVLRNARITERPQVKFHDKIDNSSTPFEPRIKEKPNSLKPLAILLEALPDEHVCYSHPYEFELDRFQERIDSLNLAPKEPQCPRPIDETPLLMISQEDQLQEMLQDLRSQTEIAVDLEHHGYRSFQGFTCLMQISTREKDYIVDTLDLRHRLHILNEVFTNPKIVKVFHGADCDVQWLQRDFSLYVVNMFDTYQAALLLSLPRLSLAHLLKTCCNIDANKYFQLYDWRTRPLVKDAIKYAREDTHYLLYIYDMLWNKLLEKSGGGTQMLQSAIFRSADTCKKRYWKSIYKEDSYESMYRQSKKNFDNRQMYALKELYAWRDRTAREEDESSGYVLPNHMLLLIAEKLPKEMQGILACCNPIPPLVRQNLVLLHQIILKAREQPLIVKVSSGINIENRIRPTTQTNINLEGALHCPHDLTQNVDFRDDLPTLLDNNHDLIRPNTDLMENSSVTRIFAEIDEIEDCNLSKINLPNQIHFMSPFERYKKMLRYMETEKHKSAEDKEREIAEDTRKLLDQCMRERLKSAVPQVAANLSGEMLNRSIKEENESMRESLRSAAALAAAKFCGEMFDRSIKEENEQDNGCNPRKRDRSIDSTYTEAENSFLNATIKTEVNNSKKNVNKKNKNKRSKMSAYEKFKTDVLNSTPQQFMVKNKKDLTEEDEGPYKSTKTKHNNREDIVAMSVGAKKKKLGAEEFIIRQNQNSNDNFTPYDYSQVNYKEYQHSDISETPKHAPGKFKHKGKKKQQNKTFTFARQFGSGNSKKS